MINPKSISKEMYWNNATKKTKDSRPNFNLNLVTKDIENSDLYFIVANRYSEVNS